MDSGSRAEAFLLWATYGWRSDTSFKRYTHWAKMAADVGGAGEGEYNYDYVMRAENEKRAERFAMLAKWQDEDGKTKFNYMCRDMAYTLGHGHFEDEEENFYDPWYSYGHGALTELGEYFSTVDWEEIGVKVLFVWSYIGFSFIGPWVFPPMLICLWTTEGNLDYCSFGVWGNDYTDR